ncbi:MAG: homoserine kinase [Methylococcaceae bacterium]|nr:homoserine kinase [Methylococcaceae bacterium]
MSVYTAVSSEELRGFLSHYQLGELIEFSGIEDGIDNTNYRLRMTTGDYILTLFENLKPESIPFFLNLLNHLQQAGTHCPQAHADNNGEMVRVLQAKAATIFSCLRGSSVLEPTIKQCEAIGSELGKIHLAGLNYSERRASDMGEDWFQQAFDKIKHKLVEEDLALITQQLLRVKPVSSQTLPKGIIHADLFKDNALFTGDKLTGVLDFYLACYDDLLLDLAITVNDWCQHQGQLQVEKMTALIGAYQQQRSLTHEEKQLWPITLQKAALRFWLSRLEHQHFPRASELTVIKDPNIYKQIFIQHLQTQPLA